ncbi:cytochrome P450 [Ascobolus immersus RN42]|uniref:Cytochrome P450 n=1 Tax=Ascobolus immersus RN42 TaxID=1160509 RepID=A0A3N4I9W6_ASCIM|nr:cytochrome P450 [Ascobolus immersus RN42]
MEAFQNLKNQSEKFLASNSVDLGFYRSYIDPIKQHWIITALVVFVVYEVGVTFYRLYFHPLAKFPGPKLAAASTLYEFYYDYIGPKRGYLSQHVLDLHDQYGDIFRIGPNKLRVNSLDGYDKIHAVGSPFCLTYFYDGFQLDKGVLCLKDNKVHGDRRKLMNNLFSKKEMSRLMPLVRSKTQLFFDRIMKDCQEGEGETVFEAHHRVQAIASDIVMEFSYGRSYQLLEQENQRHLMNIAMDQAINTFPLGKYIPWYSAILQRLPDSVNEWIFPGSSGFSTPLHLLPFSNSSTAAFPRSSREMGKEIEALFKKKEAGTFKKDPNAPATIYYELLEQYDDPEALLQDATLMYSAGVDTTTWFLSCAFYQLAANPEIERKLLEEIKTVWPVKEQRPEILVLESLPYLAAFIKETRRLSYGVLGALPRLSPPSGATLSNQFIPGGVVCETSSYCIHHHRAFGPRAETLEFRPERWLDPANKHLEKYIVNFGSGSRSCLGMHMAMLEIYHVLPGMVRLFEIGLGEKLKKEGLQWRDRWLPLKIMEDVDFVLKVREE